MYAASPPNPSVLIPDTVVVALIAAVAPTLAVVFTRYKTKGELGQIHILVNGRLSDALKEIAELRAFIDAHSDIHGSSEQLVPRSADVPAVGRRGSD